jgi:hypothetical protein
VSGLFLPESSDCVTDLIYPAFPRRPFVVGGLVVAALIAVAVVVNLRGPNVARCTAVAKHEVASQGRVSASWFKACDGLSTRQITTALETAYQAEFGRYLRGTPLMADLPPSSYRAASARAALKESAESARAALKSAASSGHRATSRHG